MSHFRPKQPSTIMLATSLFASLLRPAFAEPPGAVDDPRAVIAKMLPDCAPRYAETDARVTRAGVNDASYYRIEGFPYLRTDRLMASFKGELDDDEALEAWLLQLRDNDQFSRDIELRNLGMDERERVTLLLDLRLCAVWLSFFESTDPQRRKALIDAARVPQAPSASAPPKRKAGGSARGTEQIWRSPVDEAEARRLLAAYDRLPEDALHRKGMTSDGWQALAAHFAPTWSMTGPGPGALRWQGERLAIDHEQAAVYYLPSFARAGNQVLVQFIYFLWFASADDALIDGLIWRVTLDPQGRPLIYDSLRADGSDHRFHLAQALDPLGGDDGTAAPPAGIAGVGPVQVRLGGNHPAAREVLPAPSAGSAETRSYALLPYETLLTLPRADEGTRSAFDADGLLHQPDSAIRQWGRHATPPTLKAALDDPRLIESHYQLPPTLLRETYALLQASSP